MTDAVSSRFPAKSDRRATEAVKACLDSEAPRASAFIATLYGDVAVPRGGTLWMGSVIACCAEHGISESLARTAVSRLVGAGRLEGERNGRRSYYRLTEAGQAEFEGAARIFYDPPSEPIGWLLALGESGAAAAAELPGWARLGPAGAMAPNRADIPLPPGPVLSAETVQGVRDLRDLVARSWPLADVAARYRGFIGRFAPVDRAVQAALPDPALALALRLRLVHEYRHAALADPRLPRAAWPEGWPGVEARRLFVRLYLALAEPADRQIGLSFHDAAGQVPEDTAQSRLRIDRLRRERARYGALEAEI